MVSMVSTSTLGVGYLFHEESIGYFRSGVIGVMINEKDVSERYEGYWDGEEFCVCFVGLSSEFGGEDCSEDSEWELGEVMIVSVSGSYLIESGKELGFGLELDYKIFQWESSEEIGVGG